jgi:hypothetical protein
MGRDEMGQNARSWIPKVTASIVPRSGSLEIIKWLVEEEFRGLWREVKAALESKYFRC